MRYQQIVPGPASLTVWPSDVSIKAAEPRELSSLQEALDEALKTLNEGTGTPWVTTSEGLILSPAHLRGMLHSCMSAGERRPIGTTEAGCVGQSRARELGAGGGRPHRGS